MKPVWFTSSILRLWKCSHTLGLYLLVTGFVEIGAQHSHQSICSSVAAVYPPGLSLVLPAWHPRNLSLYTRLVLILNIFE